MGAAVPRRVCMASQLAPLIARAQDRKSIRAAARLYVRSGRPAFTWRPKSAFSVQDFIAFARDEEVYLALLDGVLAGVATLYRPACFLHCLFVDPALQGRGVGRALLAQARATAGGPLEFKVDAPNRRAIAFYERLGARALKGPDDAGIDDGIAWRRYRLD